MAAQNWCLMRKIPKEIKRNLNDKFREPHLPAMGTAEPLNSHVVWQMMNRKQTLTEWWHLLTFVKGCQSSAHH
jgi:hypothetical protein